MPEPKPEPTPLPKATTKSLTRLNGEYAQGAALKSEASQCIEALLGHAARHVGAYDGLPRSPEDPAVVQWHMAPGASVGPARFMVQVNGEGIELTHPQHTCDLNVEKRLCRSKHTRTLLYAPST